jgi:hypothetical protein
MKQSTSFFLLILVLLFFQCGEEKDSHKEMLALLRQARLNFHSNENPYCYEAKLSFVDGRLREASSFNEFLGFSILKSQVLMELGREAEAVSIYEQVAAQMDERAPAHLLLPELAIAYFRMGERLNCVKGHAAESCILPLNGFGVHRDKTPSRKAIDAYKAILAMNPDDLSSRWLLNLAYMTVDEYPSGVPHEFLIPGLLDTARVTTSTDSFVEIAGDLSVNVRNASGGSIVDDFDNDGNLDIVTSSWSLDDPLHFFKNNINGIFLDHTKIAGIDSITGGLMIMQTDYNNDGLLDIFVPRGGWQKKFGRQPKSLLRNNGDGTFTDVSTKAGLISMHPSQTATWNDFNNDGWVDVFIGNESEGTEQHPCELYINNRDETFKNIANDAGVEISDFVKGVTSGDYDNDGDQDIFISTFSTRKYLFVNESAKGAVRFRDATTESNLDKLKLPTFPTWFWDYDNDGWLDIFVAEYSVKPLSQFAAAHALESGGECNGTLHLFKNNGDKTFIEVSQQAGLCDAVYPMGSNFGDINNDGFLDFYLGTGNPDYKSVVPNKLYKNLDGNTFEDVTITSRTGHLQKGHGVCFADLDNDGDQDIYAEMGGAYAGDSYDNVLFMNRSQDKGHWISISLQGNNSNRMGIGSRIKLVIVENGIRRAIYRDVNSGGSFGGSPLRKEIGLGKAQQIEELEISWSGSGKVQRFTAIRGDQFIRIREGSNHVETLSINKIGWKLSDPLCRTN